MFGAQPSVRHAKLALNVSTASCSSARKRISLSEFSLCLSRACLGKNDHLQYSTKWHRERCAFSYLSRAVLILIAPYHRCCPPSQNCSQPPQPGGSAPPSRRRAATPEKTIVFFECFAYVCPEPVLVKRSDLYRNGSKHYRFRIRSMPAFQILAYS
jgi:hypothetical protein